MYYLINKNATEIEKILLKEKENVEKLDLMILGNEKIGAYFITALFSMDGKSYTMISRHYLEMQYLTIICENIRANFNKLRK